MKKNKIQTKHCVVCNNIFTYQAKKGRSPITCSDECRLLRIKNTNAHSPVIRNFNCVVCNIKSLQRGLGPLKKYCKGCNPRRKGGVIRTYTCTVCDGIFKQMGKGYLRKRCQDCASNYRTQQKRPLIIRTYECDGCHVIFRQNGKGRSRLRCNECAVMKNKKYKKEVKKKKVIRSYTCVNCNVKFTQSGRGRLRVRCKSCVPRKHKIPESFQKNLVDLIIGGLFE